MANIVSDYSAVADGGYETLTLTIANGGTSLTRSSGVWPFNIAGKGISIGGSDQFTTPFLSTTVASRPTNTRIVLSDVAPSALSAASRLVCYGTDNLTPFANFTAANQGGAVSLTIPAGIYYVSYANPIFDGITTLTVNATGATLAGGIVNFAVSGQYQSNTHQAKTASVNAGTASVTLLTPAENSRFTVGQYALMTGLDPYSIGFPTNQHFFEYVAVSGISGATISFSTPLQNAYLSTWPHYSSGDAFAPDYGGPATLYALSPNWNCTHVFNGLTFVQTLQVSSSGRNVTWNSCTFIGGGVFPTQAGTWLMDTCNCSAAGLMEIDKLLSSVTFSVCTMVDVQVQSSSLKTLVVKSGTTLANLVGTAQNTTIEDSTISTSLQIGPSTYGVGQSLTVRNSAIPTNTTWSQEFIAVGLLSYDGNGTFRIANAVPAPWPSAVPGKKYAFVYYSGSINAVPDSGTIVSFRIVAIRQDSTYTYYDTDLRGALPTPVFSGAFAANYYMAMGIESIIQTGGSGPSLASFVAPSAIAASAWAINS